MLFRNYYRCERCGHEWTHESSAKVPDHSRPDMPAAHALNSVCEHPVLVWTPSGPKQLVGIITAADVL
jgi:hypothetical protein